MSFKQSDGSHTLTIVRRAELASAVVLNWHTSPGVNSLDYQEFKGKISFAPGESTAVVIIPSPLFTKDHPESSFTVRLEPVTMPILTGEMTCEVKILNDIRPAKIGFSAQTTDVKQSDKKITLKLERQGFALTEASVGWKLSTRLGTVFHTLHWINRPFLNFGNHNILGEAC
jgi:hypothetical protein